MLIICANKKLKCNTINTSSEYLNNWKWKWRDIWPSIVTHTQNSCSAINLSQVHTQQWTHTHTGKTHPEQWAAIYAAAPREQLGVRCLAQGHLSRGIEGGESAVHSLLTYNPCRTWDSQRLDYKYDSLTIRLQQVMSWTLIERIAGAHHRIGKWEPGACFIKQVYQTSQVYFN